MRLHGSIIGPEAALKENDPAEGVTVRRQVFIDQNKSRRLERERVPHNREANPDELIVGAPADY